MPGTSTNLPEQARPDKGDGVIRLTHVSKPTIELFRVKSDEPTPFVIVCPGGGYGILAYNKEGTDVAKWLNSIGVSAGVLKYRVPKNRDGALMDARRAMRMVRENISEWNIDSEHIGMLGFSAGGHLTAACSQTTDRPDFSVLIYPAYLFMGKQYELPPSIHVNADTPPAFIIQAQDDHRFYRSSLAYCMALDTAQIPVELHLFTRGGHGFGLAPQGSAVAAWPALCEKWMISSGFLNR